MVNPKVHEKRRVWVNTTYGKMVEGTSMSNARKSSLMSKLWKRARRKYPGK